MLLAIDIGNTDTVIGLFEKNVLHKVGRFASDQSQARILMDNSLAGMLSGLHLKRESIRGCAVSSVVPKLTSTFLAWSGDSLGIAPLVISANLPLGIRFHYDDPSTLGADRICNIIAAFGKFGGPAIVVDFGTATTYSVIGETGDFLGGVIAPGVKTAAAGLFRTTAQLPEVELKFPSSVLGTNTNANIQSGILYAGVDAAEGMIRRLKSSVGESATVIATGGLSELIASKIPAINRIEKNLVLEGIAMIYDRCNRLTL